jgi:prevent-host-death family protein
MKKLRPVSLAIAKARLSELVDRAADGEEVLITRNGKPMARLVKAKKIGRFRLGDLAGRVKIAKDLSLPREISEAFYARPRTKLR